MLNNLFSTGLILLAMAVPTLAGCKYSPENIREAFKDYSQLKQDGGVPDYKPTGDATIDGILSVPVKQAHQYQLEFDRWASAADASPIVAKFGGKSPEDIEKDLDAMSPADRKTVEEAVAAAKAQEQGQLKTLLTQATEVAKGLSVAVAKVQKGDAGGMLQSGAALAGPGKDAIAQANQAIKFCDMAVAMIDFYKKEADELDKVIKRNSQRQATGR
jgi:hypothetical protein